VGSLLGAFISFVSLSRFIKKQVVSGFLEVPTLKIHNHSYKGSKYTKQLELNASSSYLSRKSLKRKYFEGSNISKKGNQHLIFIRRELMLN